MAPVVRKLASIQRVLAMDAIPGADAIELVRINGWSCVVKKGEFRVGELGVYLEIDAVPPDIAAFWFLWTPKGAVPGAAPRPASARIRTIRLRGCLSQGLLLPLVKLGLPDDLPEGLDVTDRLGVGKYEAPLPVGMGQARGSFPRRVPKTDELRVQSVPAVLDELRGLPYVITEKVDGTSATFLVDPDDGSFHACGRNWSILAGANAYWSVAERYDLEARLRAAGARYAVQGEVCGPGVQKNPLGLTVLTLALFNAWDLVEHRHLDHDELVALAADLGVPTVRVLEEGESFVHDQAALLSLAEGHYPGTKNEREGIVIRSRRTVPSATVGGRLSFKAISNRYLLKEG